MSTETELPKLLDVPVGAPVHRTVVANVRVTPSEKAFLKQEAREAGLTVSEFGRRRLLGHKVHSQADLSVVNELRRLGGLLKHLHNQSGLDTSAVLRELRAYLEGLSR